MESIIFGFSKPDPVILGVELKFGVCRGYDCGVCHGIIALMPLYRYSRRALYFLVCTHYAIAAAAPT